MLLNKGVVLVETNKGVADDVNKNINKDLHSRYLYIFSIFRICWSFYV
jgi:hypothetical protein